MKYQTRSRHSGTVIDEFNTYKEAIEAIEYYEAEDKRRGYYTPKFYEVYDIQKETVCF